MPDVWRNRVTGEKSQSDLAPNGDAFTWERVKDPNIHDEAAIWTAPPVYGGMYVPPGGQFSSNKGGGKHSGKVALFCIVASGVGLLVIANLLSAANTAPRPRGGVHSAACSSYWDERFNEFNIGMAIGAAPASMRKCAIAEPRLFGARSQR